MPHHHYTSPWSFPLGCVPFLHWLTSQGLNPLQLPKNSGDLYANQWYITQEKQQQYSAHLGAGFFLGENTRNVTLPMWTKTLTP